MTDTRSVVDAYFGFRAKQDLDGLLTLIADDAEFHAFGDTDLPWIGTFTGRARVAEFFKLIGKGITDAGTDIETMVIDGEEAVVFGRIRSVVNATGNRFDSPYALRLTVRDGLIVRHHVYEDSLGLHRQSQPG